MNKGKGKGKKEPVFPAYPFCYVAVRGECDFESGAPFVELANMLLQRLRLCSVPRHPVELFKEMSKFQAWKRVTDFLGRLLQMLLVHGKIYAVHADDALLSEYQLEQLRGANVRESWLLPFDGDAEAMGAFYASDCNVMPQVADGH